MNRITFLKIQPLVGLPYRSCKRVAGCVSLATHEVITGASITESNGDRSGTSTTRKGCLDHCRELATRELGRLEP